MSFPQLRTSQEFFASRVPAQERHLTSEEWDLIVEALSAYRHHTLYRELYEKLAPLKPCS